MTSHRIKDRRKPVRSGVLVSVFGIAVTFQNNSLGWIGGWPANSSARHQQSPSAGSKLAGYGIFSAIRTEKAGPPKSQAGLPGRRLVEPGRSVSRAWGRGIRIFKFWPFRTQKLFLLIVLVVGFLPPNCFASSLHYCGYRAGPQVAPPHPKSLHPTSPHSEHTKKEHALMPLRQYCILSIHLT